MENEFGKLQEQEYLDVYVQETTERVESLSGELLDFEQGRSDDLGPFLRDIHNLKGDSGIAGFDDISRLCCQVEEYLDIPHESGWSLNAGQIQLLFDVLDYTRQHTETLGRGEQPSPVPEKLVERLGCLELSSKKQVVGKLIYDSNGVVATITPKSVNIILPAVKSCGRSDAIITSLHAVFVCTPYACSWQVDLSALEKIPIWLLGTLFSFQNDLRSRGQQVSLIGVNEKHLTPGLKNRLGQLFPVRYSRPNRKGKKAS